MSSLRQVPYTANTGALIGRQRVSHRELAAIYDQGAELLQAMGTDDLKPLGPQRRERRRENGSASAASGIEEGKL